MHFHLRIPLLCILGSVAAIFSASAEPAAAAKKKIVFIAGRPSHPPGEHEHRAGCLLLEEQLKKSGLTLETSVVTNGWPADESVFDNASAVVIYSDGGPGNPVNSHLDKLKSLAHSGVGIGCIHYAVEIPKGEGGDTFLELLGGYFESDWSVNPHWHASFKLPKHAVTRGIGDFDTTDEWYYHMRFRKNMEGVTSILTDLPPPESLTRADGPHEGNPEVRAAVLERKEPQTVMWVYDRPAAAGAGRSFGFCGGHFHKNWQIDNQRRLVLNAIVWIANMEVPETGVPSKTPTDEEMHANLDAK
ncbi:MAG: ThuA domain-containing protein [Luteolibacter sp.]